MLRVETAAAPTGAGADFMHARLNCGIELALDHLAERSTVSMTYRMLTGVADEPAERTGIGSIVERTLSKGTRKYDGPALADAFDRLGAQWGSASGRQSMAVRVLCLPEFTLDTVALVAELLCRPTFRDDACRVALDLAQQELRQLEDDPDELLRQLVQSLTLGPVYGRHIGGTAESLARISADAVREHWRTNFHAGAMQVAVAGAVDFLALQARLEECFAGFGEAAPRGRGDADYTFEPGRAHRHKDLEQQYIGLTLEGLPRQHPDFAVEQVAIAVLAGGMSGRLFTEVREKQGLVYWVGAWHEQPRGKGVIHLGASTTPERCEKTYQTLLRELARLGEDLTEAETRRARDGMIAHLETEDDLTRARAGGLSDDLFHYGRPIGLAPRVEALRQVTVGRVEAYARQLDPKRICVATLGPKPL